MSCHFVGSGRPPSIPSIDVLIKIMKIILNPNTAKPATPSPMTVPPVKDTFNALDKLVFAASAVLTLASVAMRIPMFPATAENTAPMTNATTINQCVFSTSVETTASAAPEMTTKMANSRYSAFRKASAPSCI